MKIALWTLQVLWGVFFSLNGFGKILCYKPALWNQALHEVPWFSAVPQDLFVAGQINCRMRQELWLQQSSGQKSFIFDRKWPLDSELIVSFRRLVLTCS